MSDTPLSAAQRRHQRLQALFHDALDRAPAERDAWLAREAADDQALLAEVQALLAFSDSAASTWRSPAASVVAEALASDRAANSLADEDASAMLGRRIGSYVITRHIGTGGMGAVYEGTRDDEQFSMRVAIKLLRRGADSDLAVRRFRYERQILANLRHRNIAALLDGGVTDDGQPYFVMEYVDGEPITAYAAAHTLDVRARVQLLRQVCGAVQHAHESLVVHRDLKPGNILVTPDGTVKLLDFGIARLLREPDGLDQLPATEGHLRAFTPDYASPEQYRGLPAQPSSDIYSLGVIACELLSGRRPFDLRGRLLRDMQTLVCDTPAPLASQLVTDTSDRAFAATYGVRNSARLRELVRGDLDAIVAQALRKEPDRRYRSAEQFTQDLQRYLDGHPVLARRDRLSYRAFKFAARHRIEVAAVSLVVVALVVGTVVSVRAARRAERERANAEQVNAFLRTMLAAANPDVQGKDVTVAQVLAQATRDLASKRLTPEIESDIRLTLANTYTALGVYDSAAVHAARAYALRTAEYGARHARVADVNVLRANIAEGQGNYAAADTFATEAVRAYEAQRPIDGNALAAAMDVQARVIETEGKLDDAERIKRALLALRRQGTDTASRAGLTFALTNLATTLLYRGKGDEALALQREAVEVEASVHGRDKPNYIDVLRGLAGVYEEIGRLHEADSIMQLVLPPLRTSLGPAHPTYLRAVNAAARVRLRAGDPTGAVPLAQEVVMAIGGPLPEADVTAASALQVLGAALDSLRRTDEAEAIFKRALDMRVRTLQPGNWIIAAAEAQLGAHYLLVHRYDVAERLLLRGYEGVAKEHGVGAPYSVSIAKRVALLYKETQQPGREAEWQAKASGKP